MIDRDKKGRLHLDYFEFKKFLQDIFEYCNTEDEVEEINDDIRMISNRMADERYEEILRGEV